jgi:hypothetical protein
MRWAILHGQLHGACGTAARGSAPAPLQGMAQQVLPPGDVQEGAPESRMAMELGNGGICRP